MNLADAGRVLVVDRGDGSCGELHCRHLREVIERRKLFTEIVDNTNAEARAGAPRLIILRVAHEAEGRVLASYYRLRWNTVPIVLILCSAARQAGDELASLLVVVDEFLFCSAMEPELGLRIARLLDLPRFEAARNLVPENEPLVAMPLVGKSPAFADALRQASCVAGNDATVLISGETGSGKELFARAIHYQGARRAQPFVPVNCGALPDHLFENELFGHAKGAFTDARSAEKGLIAEAQGGTLFLDEIDGLSAAAQIKLLRFLQNGEYRPLGSAAALLANVRIIAATNADLKREVERKQFREDLYYRLNILSVVVPPLRERGEDIVQLAEHFLRLYSESRRAEGPCFSKTAQCKLMAYSWPGNVRELEGVIQRSLLLKPSGILHAADIGIAEGKGKELLRHESLRRAKSLVVGEFERGYVTSLLAKHQGNITRAAKAAGKDRRTLQRLLRKYSLDRESFKI